MRLFCLNSLDPVYQQMLAKREKDIKKPEILPNGDAALTAFVLTAETLAAFDKKIDHGVK